MHLVIAIGLLVTQIAGCSGVAGARETATELVATTHCDSRACTASPRPRHLGEGCYVVQDPDSEREHLYDCSTDLRPAGRVSCTDVTPCSGACKTTITIDGRELAIERCLPRWNADRAARRGPPTCSPVHLRVVIEPPATAAVPSTLTLPTELVQEVIRSGKSRVVFEAEACATDNGVVIGEPTKRTGFAKLDAALHRELGALDGIASPGACATVTLLVFRFECEIDKALL